MVWIGVGLFALKILYVVFADRLIEHTRENP